MSGHYVLFGVLFQLTIFGTAAFSTLPTTIPLPGKSLLQTPSFQRNQRLFSTPPPLSPLSDNDSSEFDDYTPDEVTKMRDVIVSLSEESKDEIRRARLQTILQVALDGPNGGPKRFATLFQKVLTQVGEQVQQEAREKHMEAVAAKEAAGEEEEVVVDDDDENNPQLPKLPEKTPEELKLWALVDMMVQSKTLIKNHKF